MERVALTVMRRDTGKGPARRARMAGKIPGVLYGNSIEPMPVEVDAREINSIVKKGGGMNVLLDLSVEGGDSGLALIRDYQADPFKREFKHIDFQAITMKDKLDLEVSINLLGKSIGVKDGGVVELHRRTLHVKAMPDKIPDKIDIDISGLNIGDSIHADEVVMPEGVEFSHKVNFTLVAVVPPAKIEESTTTTGVEGEEVAVEGAAEGGAEGEKVAAEGGDAASADGKKEGKE